MITNGENTGDRSGDSGCIVAVIPAHNEERFIGSVVLKTRRYVDAVIVVDDGSRDETAALAAVAWTMAASRR